MDSAGGSTVLKSPGFVSVRYAASAVYACWCTSLLLPHVLPIRCFQRVQIRWSSVFRFTQIATDCDMSMLRASNMLHTRCFQCVQIGRSPYASP